MRGGIPVVEKKYAKNVVPIKFVKGRGTGDSKQMVWMTGKQMGGMEVDFVIEVYDETGEWPPGTHVHAFDECLVFFGWDEDMDYLGADMTLALGKEAEVHRFNKPSVIAVPANMPHCPLGREKVYRKFGHFHLAGAGKYGATYIPTEGTTDGNKYNYLFHTLKAEPGEGGANARQIVSVEGGRDLSGVPLSFSFGTHNGTGELYPGKGSLVHPYDSVLIFFGRKPEERTYLGAEISIELGEEHEKYTFDAPTVIWLPKGTPHFPITCNKCEHTYTFVQVGLTPKYEAMWVK
jgi:hypothetical protein